MSPGDILKFLFDMFIYVVLLRFLLQLTRADFYNPLSQFVVKVTQPLLKPLRRLIPGLGGIDLAALLLAAAMIALRNWLFGSSMMFQLGFLLALPFDLALLVINVLVVVLFARMLLSWVDPYGNHPMQRPLVQLTEPLIRPFRRIIQPIGSFDLSPMFALLGLYLLIWIVNSLPGWLGGLIS
jgi:YggT family protein